MSACPWCPSGADRCAKCSSAVARAEERAAIVAELERIAGIQRKAGAENLARFAEALAAHFSTNQHTRKG